MASRLSLTLSLAILLGFPGLSPGIEMEHSLTVDSSKWVISSGRVATLPAGSMLALALALPSELELREEFVVMTGGVVLAMETDGREPASIRQDLQRAAQEISARHSRDG